MEGEGGMVEVHGRMRGPDAGLLFRRPDPKQVLKHLHSRRCRAVGCPDPKFNREAKEGTVAESCAGPEHRMHDLRYQVVGRGSIEQVVDQSAGYFSRHSMSATVRPAGMNGITCSV